MKLLLELGADATTVDNDGNTALHGVAIWGSNDAVEMLVKAGAKLDVKNKRGLTPWRIAEGAVFEDAVLAQPADRRVAQETDGRARAEGRVAGTTRTLMSEEFPDSIARRNLSSALAKIRLVPDLVVTECRCGPTAIPNITPARSTT